MGGLLQLPSPARGALWPNPVRAAVSKNESGSVTELLRTYNPELGTQRCHLLIDHIRQKGNEANHKIVMISRADAEELLIFSEMLLTLTYEFPNRLSKRPA